MIEVENHRISLPAIHARMLDQKGEDAFAILTRIARLVTLSPLNMGSLVLPIVSATVRPLALHTV